jgi:hypothetical protein
MPLCHAGIALLLLLVTAPCGAATILSTAVTENEGRYHVAFDVRIDADVGKVRAILTDLERSDELSDTVIEHKLIETRADGSQRVRFTLHSCVLFFCRDLRKTTDVRGETNGDIVFVTVPGDSDFRTGRESWHIEVEGTGARLQYRADLEPSFYVPPLIGPWLVKMRIRNELETTAKRIEIFARNPAPR